MLCGTRDPWIIGQLVTLVKISGLFDEAFYASVLLGLLSNEKAFDIWSEMCSVIVASKEHLLQMR